MKRILAYKAKVELLAGGHFWPRAKCGTKLAWTGPFGRIWLENGIPAQTRMVRTGFWPVLGEAGGRHLGGNGGGEPPPAKVALGFVD